MPEEKILVETEPDNSEEFDKEAEAIDCAERQADEEEDSRRKWLIAILGLCIIVLLIIGAYTLR